MKTLTVEELLSWAFVHELPKGGGVEGLANAHSAWGTICELGVKVDRGSTGSQMGVGDPNTWIEQGDPHPDALRVGEAVRALGACSWALPFGWNPLADWIDAHGLASAAIARVVEGRLSGKDVRRRGQDMLNLVVTHAILGKRPDWQADEPKVRMVETGGTPCWFVKRTFVDALGREYQRELEGFNLKTRRPMPDAYRKHEYAQDVSGAILSRLDWQLWAAAQHWLGQRLTERLSAHRLTPVLYPPCPWFGAAAGGSAFIVEEETAKKPAIPA